MILTLKVIGGLILFVAWVSFLIALMRAAFDPPVVAEEDPDVEAGAKALAQKCLDEISEPAYPHQERMNSYAAELRRQILDGDHDRAASAVIGDDFPACAGSTDTIKNKEVIERNPAVTATTPSAGGDHVSPVAEQSAAATRSPLILP